MTTDTTIWYYVYFFGLLAIAMLTGRYASDFVGYGWRGSLAVLFVEGIAWTLLFKFVVGIL